MPVMDDLTEAEKAKAQELIEENAGYGWRRVEKARKFEPGLRIRHGGQQYYEAYERGTGNILAVLQRHEAIELIVAYDEPRFPGGSRITQLASYHVDLGPFGDWLP